VRRDDGGGWMTMDFPARTEGQPSPEVVPGVERALGMRPVEVVSAGPTLIARFDSEAQVRGSRPDMAAIAELPYNGVIATAPGDTVDFVSRFFGPRVGIDEDPVTGSAHTGLVPFWSRRLRKTEFEALQVSERGGRLRCALKGERVDIAGQAVLYLSGEIVV
jgi:predicted PhzF superfamily epimerase YddE/YHI9